MLSFIRNGRALMSNFHLILSNGLTFQKRSNSSSFDDKILLSWTFLCVWACEQEMSLSLGRT